MLTGQTKIQNIVDEYEALKGSIRKEVAVARQALKEGKRVEKERHQEIVERARLRKRQNERIKKIVKDLKNRVTNNWQPLFMTYSKGFELSRG